MIEKICGHCGTTLLMGLEYCPGCLRLIQNRTNSASNKASRSQEINDLTPDGKLSMDSMITDFHVTWANLVYPIKAQLSVLLKRPYPAEPPPMPSARRADDQHFGHREKNAAAKMRFSEAYTRVVCPMCHRTQRRPLDQAPSDLITCINCSHPFPGSFAAEFRKGADLECFQCGVTTFCVSGLQLTTCPNCQSHSHGVVPRTRLKPKVLIAVFTLCFLLMFSGSIVTNTTPQFLIWAVLTFVGSAVGFVTLAALGV